MEQYLGSGDIFGTDYNAEEIEKLKKEFKAFKKDREKKKKRNKVGTARQVALAFIFMVDAEHLPKGVLDPSKNGRFLEFMTGISYETLRKPLGKIDKGELSGIKTGKQIKEVLKDLNTIRLVFENVMFEKEIELIDKYIEKLENDLEDLKVIE